MHKNKHNERELSQMNEVPPVTIKALVKVGRWAVMLDLGEHPLQQMGVDAQPTQSLTNVADKIGHAAVLGQRPHQCIQIAKEFWKSEQYLVKTLKSGNYVPH